MQWGELRRQAKALESEIDLKLTEFGKVGSSSFSGSTGSRAPYATQSSNSQSYGDLCNDIEGLLQRYVSFLSTLFLCIGFVILCTNTL